MPVIVLRAVCQVARLTSKNPKLVTFFPFYRGHLIIGATVIYLLNNKQFLFFKTKNIQMPGILHVSISVSKLNISSSVEFLNCQL